MPSNRVYGVSDAEARVAKGGRAGEEETGLVRCLLTAATAVLTMTILVLLVVYFVAAEKSTAFDWPSPSPSVMGSFDHFALTTDHTLCAHAGKSIISSGGNAVDAAIASMFCLGATNPQSSGLGGGFLMTLYNASTGSCTAIDAREEAPALATEKMFVNNSDGSKYGFLAAGVPGELAGYWEIFRRFGSRRVEWKQLVQPTIDLLSAGVPVSAYLDDVMKVKEKHFRLFPSMKLWINPATNATYAAGEKMPRAKLLKTLKRIAAAQDPVQLFYHGEFADIIDREMKANGGIIRKSDLEAYKVRIHETPLVAHLKNGLAICGGPPPSGFAVTQLIINLMSNLYPNSSVYHLRHDAKVYHHHIEAQKFAYAQRTLMGDSAFVPSADQLSKRMLTPAFLASVLEKMSDHAHETAYYGGDNKAARSDFGTSHVSVLDKDGNGVSATTTINRWFGAAVESEELGIVWNDEMDDFSTPGMANGFGFAPSETNFIAPGKRPMSSMSPLVVYDDRDKKIRMVAGASGGSKIISALAKAVVRTLIFGETVKEAIDAPMLHNQFTPDISQTDQFFPLELKSMLESDFGQKFRNTTGFEGIVQAIHAKPDGKINACGDFRRKTDQTPAGN